MRLHICRVTLEPHQCTKTTKSMPIDCMISLYACFYFTFDDQVLTSRQKHCSLWLCHAIGVLIHGLTDKSDTVVEFDSDRYFFFCDCLTSGNSACLSNAAAMLS